MAYTSSLHLSKHLLLPRSHRTKPSSSRSPSFVPAAAARVNGAPAPHANGSARINGAGVNGHGGKAAHVNGHGAKGGVDLYGLDVLAHGLQDESWNVTRFLLLSRPPSPVALPKDADAKTSMVVAHRGGSMAVVLKVLSAFSSRNINMTKLEVINNDGGGGEPRAPVMILDTGARGAPTLRSFPHVLYVDCEGAADDPLVRDAIKEIEKFAVFVRVLGCYAADTNVYDLQ